MNRRTVLKSIAALLAASLVGKVAPQLATETVPEANGAMVDIPGVGAYWQDAEGDLVDVNGLGHWVRPIQARHGVDFFVGPGGDDAASGLTYADRLLSVRSAVGSARRGDRILLASGIHRDCVTLEQPKETDV